MIFFISLIPATLLAVLGYFVLFASTRTQGGLERLGQYLGAWILFLAAATVLGGLLGSTLGVPDPMAHMTQHMERMEKLAEEQLAALRGLERN